MVSLIKTIIKNNTDKVYQLRHYPDCQLYIKAGGSCEYKGDIFSTIANDRERLALLAAVAANTLTISYVVDGLAKSCGATVNEVMSLPPANIMRLGISIDKDSSQDSDTPVDATPKKDTVHADNIENTATADGEENKSSLENAADDNDNTDSGEAADAETETTSNETAASEPADTDIDVDTTEQDAVTTVEDPQTEQTKQSRRRKNIQIG